MHRSGEREGIGSEHRLMRASRPHDPRTAHHHRQRDESPAGEPFDIRPERAEVVRVPHGDDRQAGLVEHAIHCLGRRLPRRLGESVRRVDPQERRAHGFDDGNRGAVDLPRLQRLDIPGHAEGAMTEGTVALASRAVRGKDVGDPRRGARTLEDLGDPAREVGDGNV